MKQPNNILKHGKILTLDNYWSCNGCSKIKSPKYLSYITALKKFSLNRGFPSNMLVDISRNKAKTKGKCFLWMLYVKGYQICSKSASSKGRCQVHRFQASSVHVPGDRCACSRSQVPCAKCQVRGTRLPGTMYQILGIRCHNKVSKIFIIEIFYVLTEIANLFYTSTEIINLQTQFSLR